VATFFQCHFQEAIWQRLAKGCRRRRALPVRLGSLAEAGMELVPGPLPDHGYSKALCRGNLSSLAWLCEGSDFFAQVGLERSEGMWADHSHW
jgi:hypothetical protein